MREILRKKDTNKKFKASAWVREREKILAHWQAEAISAVSQLGNGWAHWFLLSLKWLCFDVTLIFILLKKMCQFSSFFFAIIISLVLHHLRLIAVKRRRWRRKDFLIQLDDILKAEKSHLTTIANNNFIINRMLNNHKMLIRT